MPHSFLSDDWFTAAKQIRDEAGDISPPGGDEITLNVTVTGAPDGDMELHLADGKFDRGHVPDAPTKATVPYAVARQLFVDGDQQAAMQAFMGGQLKVEGDISKLMMMQSAALAPNPAQLELQRKLREITA